MITDVVAVAEYLEKSVRDFTDIAVIGVSGGIDSSVVAAICTAALGKQNTHLVSMPYDHVDLASFNARSKEVAEKLGAKHYVISIGESTKQTEATLEAALGKDLAVLTRANVRPRLRMNILYSLSGELGIRTKKRARVMGTGHLSEDLVGYDTKGGDALADLFILSDLVKSEVYQLAAHYKTPQSVVDAEPSAGLYPGQTDKGELGYDYYELEAPTLALFKLIQSGLRPEQIDAENPVFKGLDPERSKFVVSRYKLHYHKHQAPATVSCRKPEWFK